MTTAGKTINGVLDKRNASGLTLRDPSKNRMEVTIPKEQIEEQLQGKLSVMPAGQVNRLASRQQFLDLMAVDKKNLDGGLRLVLMDGIGRSRVCSDFDPRLLEQTLDPGFPLTGS